MKLAGLLFVGLFAILSNNTSQAAFLLSEDFEGALDSRLSFSTVGTFNSGPGVKSFDGLGGSKAFGFGFSTNRASSFFNYVTTLTITFDESTFVSKVSFIEREVGNWGSQGEFYTSLEMPPIDIWDPRVGPGDWGDDFGRLPHNDYITDSSFRSRTIDVDAFVTSLHFQVWDISDLSEIYIDNLTVRGAVVPEPACVMLVSLGALCFCANGRRFVRSN